jgi:hypothetical protein
MRRLCIVVACIVASGFFSPSVASPGQGKPTEVIFANPYFKEPPPSLAQMLQSAGAVLYGRIVGGASKDGGYYRKADRGITTFYRLKIHQVLKSADAHPVDQEVTIARDGGSLDRGKKIERVEVTGFPQFEFGHDYILFLYWHAEHQAWAVSWGPHGAFEVESGKIRAVGDAAVARQQNGLLVEEFLSSLRRRP